MGTALLRLTIGLATFISSTWAQGVRIVTPTGELRFSEIQPAVDAAADGDALLVAQGHYAPFTIDGKSLAIFAVPGAEVTVGHTVVVRNLASHQVVVLSGLEVEPPSSTIAVAVRLEDDQGLVRLQDCRLGQEDWYSGYPNSFCFTIPVRDGAPAVVVTSCAGVALLDCTLFGGPGESVNDDWESCPAGTGGAGLQVDGSVVALYRSGVRGGRGGSTGYYGTGHGGTGLVATDSTVFACDGSLHGGWGGISWDSTIGPGGDGVWLSATTVLNVLGCSVAGAASSSVPGEAVTGPGLYEPLGGSPRAIAAASVVQADVPLGVAFAGSPRDIVWLLAAPPLDHLYLPALKGVWLTRFPPQSWPAPQGYVPASGTLDLQLELPALEPGVVHATLALQGLVLEPPVQAMAAGPVRPSPPAGRTILRGRLALETPMDRALASARHVLALDPQVGPDCNVNGVSDYLDVVLGTSADANHDLVPDECASGE